MKLLPISGRDSPITLCPVVQRTAQAALRARSVRRRRTVPTADLTFVAAAPTGWTLSEHGSQLSTRCPVLIALRALLAIRSREAYIPPTAAYRITSRKAGPPRDTTKPAATERQLLSLSHGG